jgi:hypothetical protein
VNWAIVIGIDEYGRDEWRLTGAVADAVRFRDWVLLEDGGNVPPDNLRLLLGRRADDPPTEPVTPAPTLDNVVTAIGDVLTKSGASGEKLYFFFAGHGIMARIAYRDEDALLTPGFDELHTYHSLALRSITEHFETMQFGDQFFLVDACRNVPWERREFEIGRWPLPRQRNPGQPPVQQFILHATSPGLTATEGAWPGEAAGAFTEVLMDGLRGEGQAKAWSWERNCYEVRWERLASYVNKVMTERKTATSAAGEPPAGGWPIQVPQDAGSRGVSGRDRDALLASFPRGRFGQLELTLELEADPVYDEAEVSVIDAVGEPVVSALRVTGTSVTFQLPPKTYAARARTLDNRVGHLRAPIELYEEKQLVKLPLSGAEGSEAVDPDATPETDAVSAFEIRSPDPLAVAEIRDEAGRVLAVERTGDTNEQQGFYRVRHVGPEQMGEEQFVVLSAKHPARVDLAAPAPEAASFVRTLAGALGGSVDGGYVTPVADAEPVAWALPSTIVTAWVGAALHGVSLPNGLEPPQVGPGEHGSGIALYAVSGNGDPALLDALRVRMWRAGEGVPEETTALRPAGAAVAAVTVAAEEPWAHWLSIEYREGEKDLATVVALPVLPGRIATVVAQVEPEQLLRLYQYHPAARQAGSSTPDRLRRLEHLERLLLGGRLDGAKPLARELADVASEDPFAGLLAGYVLLRLGLHAELRALATTIIAVAPKLSDAYVLRGECEAATGTREAANQAFADAVGVGIPAFGEGLTRLVEGLRASAFVHPRGALVRHIFQQHARGTMWSAFTPRTKLRPGRLVIAGADTGFEG